MYVCMYNSHSGHVHMRICTYTYKCSCRHMYLAIQADIYTRTYTHIHTNIHTCSHACIHIDMYMLAYTHTCLQISCTYTKTPVTSCLSRRVLSGLSFKFRSTKLYHP